MGLDIKQTKFGDLITISNNCDFAITLTSRGAAIYSIYYKKEIMTLTPKRLSTFFKKDMYHGKTIGRVAGRLKDASFKVHGISYHLKPNEKQNLLHGGDGFQYKNFDVETYETNDSYYVKFSLLSPHLDYGFPGDIKLNVIYQVYKDKPEFEIAYDAISTDDTILNITNHSYFTLGDEDILLQVLYLQANKYCPVDEELIEQSPTPVSRLFDFRNGLRLGKYIYNGFIFKTKAHGYDHNFIFDDTNDVFPKVRLVGSHFELDIYTSYPSIQIYTNNYPTKHTFLPRGKDFISRGVAIEPRLNGYNEKNLLLSRGKKYTNYIRYSFKEIYD